MLFPRLHQNHHRSEDLAWHSKIHNKPPSSLFVPPAFSCNGSAKPRTQPDPSLDLGSQTPWQHRSMSSFLLGASASWATHAPKCHGATHYEGLRILRDLFSSKEVLLRMEMLSINNASATANVLVNNELIKFPAETPMFQSVFVVMRAAMIGFHHDRYSFCSYDCLCTGLNHWVGFCCTGVSRQWVIQLVERLFHWI